MGRVAPVLLALAASCASAPRCPPCAEAAGVAPVFIPLAGVDAVKRGRAASRYAELSSMAWRGDALWLVPQYPGRYASEGVVGAALTIPRARIEAFLDGRDGAPITPARVPFDDRALRDIPGYEGVEATVIDGDRIWVCVEVAESPERASSIVVAGHITADGAVLDGARLPLAPPVPLPNAGYEALARTPRGLVAVFESNGSTLREAPWAQSLDLDLGAAATARIPFPRMEYRVTEVTALDADGRLWAMNYFFPGEFHLAPGEVPAVDTVEQLVELRWTPAGIERTARPPVVLRRGHHPRNWEGLARLPGRGVLAVTDEWPDTLLALIPTE